MAPFVFFSEQTAALESGLMVVMTAAQLLDARLLIPGAFELNAPPHRATRAPRVPPASQDVGPSPSLASTSQVESAPPGPTTRLGYAAAIVKDLALLVGIIYGVAVVPALVLWGVHAAAAFLLDTFGRQ